MTENRDFKLGFNTYGKDRVRLVKVTRGRKLLKVVFCINKLISLPRRKYCLQVIAAIQINTTSNN